MVNYQLKYLKYKKKYLNLKGGRDLKHNKNTWSRGYKHGTEHDVEDSGNPHKHLDSSEHEHGHQHMYYPKTAKSKHYNQGHYHDHKNSTITSNRSNQTRTLDGFNIIKPSTNKHIHDHLHNAKKAWSNEEHPGRHYHTKKLRDIKTQAALDRHNKTWPHDHNWHRDEEGNTIEHYAKQVVKTVTDTVEDLTDKVEDVIENVGDKLINLTKPVESNQTRISSDGVKAPEGLKPLIPGSVLRDQGAISGRKGYASGCSDLSNTTKTKCENHNKGLGKVSACTWNSDTKKCRKRIMNKEDRLKARGDLQKAAKNVAAVNRLGK